MNYTLIEKDNLEDKQIFTIAKSKRLCALLNLFIWKMMQFTNHPKHDLIFGSLIKLEIELIEKVPDEKLSDLIEYGGIL